MGLSPLKNDLNKSSTLQVQLIILLARQWILRMVWLCKEFVFQPVEAKVSKKRIVFERSDKGPKTWSYLGIFGVCWLPIYRGDQHHVRIENNFIFTSNFAIQVPFNLHLISITTDSCTYLPNGRYGSDKCKKFSVLSQLLSDNELIQEIPV